MGFLKNVFGREEPINTTADFWNWFQEHEGNFQKIVRENKNIEKDFFGKLSPKLNQLNDGIYFLTGMYDDDTVELILTPEGVVQNIVFCEELINAAPVIRGWKFTALKSAMEVKDMSIKMDQYEFGLGNIKFYANTLSEYPDEIDIAIVYANYNEADKKIIVNGCYIFIDNMLGEYKSISLIDNISFVHPSDAKEELNSIDKLESYLVWREKEFIEKYEGERYNTEKDKYSIMEGELENGEGVIAIINTDLLHWEAKASHPWMAVINMSYRGPGGLPDESTSEQMNAIEDEIMEYLKDADGYLNVGRETGQNKREIYFACKEFRKPSIVINNITKKYSSSIKMEFEIFKDKYWRTLENYMHD